MSSFFHDLPHSPIGGPGPATLLSRKSSVTPAWDIFQVAQDASSANSDCLHATLMYRIWKKRSFSSDVDGEEDCPFCLKRFVDLQSMLVHLEKECLQCSYHRPTLSSIPQCQPGCPWNRTKSILSFFGGLKEKLSRKSSQKSRRSFRLWSPKDLASGSNSPIDTFSPIERTPSRAELNAPLDFDSSPEVAAPSTSSSSRLAPPRYELHSSAPASFPSNPQGVPLPTHQYATMPRSADSSFDVPIPSGPMELPAPLAAPRYELSGNASGLASNRAHYAFYEGNIVGYQETANPPIIHPMAALQHSAEPPARQQDLILSTQSRAPVHPPPARSSTGFSTASYMTMPIQGRHSLVSQPSVSPFSEGLSPLSIPASTPVLDEGEGLFASPTEYEGSNQWNEPSKTGKQDSWSSTSTFAESFATSSRSFQSSWSSMSTLADSSIASSRNSSSAASWLKHPSLDLYPPLRKDPTSASCPPNPVAIPVIPSEIEKGQTPAKDTRLLAPGQVHAIARGPWMLDGFEKTHLEIHEYTITSGSGANFMNFSSYRNGATLMVGIDEAAKLRRLESDSKPLDKLCFAHLALAMASKVRSHISRSFYDSLIQDVHELVASDGNMDLSWRFLRISEDFLTTLQAQLDFDPKHYLRLRSVIYPGQTPSLDSLAFLKEYFYSTMFRQQLETLPQRPRTPRQNSWDSTTSTLCELEAPNVFLLGHAPKIAQDPLDGIDLPPVAVPPIDLPAFDFPPREALVPLPLDLAGVQQARDHKPTGGLRRSPPFSMSCELCQFYPARGTDQRKKMAKHLLTNKHRVAAGHEWDSGDMFQCRLRSRDGSVCLREFNRRDNFRQHCKKVHGSSSEASEVGDGQSARPWDGLPELPGNGVQRVSSTHHPHPKRRRTILGRAPPLR